MKRLIPILILTVVALAPAAQATDPASFWNAWALFFTGADGKPSAVTPSNKLPVDALVTIGSISAEINLPRDGDNTPYFSLSQVASDALTLFNAWFAAADLDRLASTSEGLKVVATGVVRVSEIPAVTGTVSVGNFPSDQTVTLSNSLGSTSNPITATITGTPEVTNPGISTATLYTGTLATDAVTLISSIVSLTANDIVEVQVRATAYRGPSDVASATLQEFGTKMAADDTFTFRYNGADFGLIADPAAVAKYGLTVYKDR